jgi:hypothetical protein
MKLNFLDAYGRFLIRSQSSCQNAFLFWMGTDILADKPGRESLATSDEGRPPRGMFGRLEVPSLELAVNVTTYQGY